MKSGKGMSLKGLEKLARQAIKKPKCDGPCHGSGKYLGYDMVWERCWKCDGTGLSGPALKFREAISPERFLELLKKSRSPRKENPKFERPTRGEEIGDMLRAIAK